MKKFPLVIAGIVVFMIVAMAIVIWNSQSSSSGAQTLDQPTTTTCVDFEGNPLSDGPCSTVPSESRTCQKAEDCQATCGFGCVNLSWFSAERADCEAEPQYTCDCLANLCQVQ